MELHTVTENSGAVALARPAQLLAAANVQGDRPDLDSRRNTPRGRPPSTDQGYGISRRAGWVNHA